ncbi:hypothetical protein RHODGE_RHODGE_03713 [Rhodoplanes serenus]|uniref:Zinc finger/thioredoxin putative domain-containing protein n=1 Tax=Rhodoplanes serenus TaxID=200615 RepID=A0A3S4BYC0_9BRAD|nr:zinc-ribbon domain-containing protein [Rhodoplanes serenus]VCU10514.1 hypothetical protein RHODGE_RHODGE_03713 [Rhodoplanes serenus]
MKIVCPQCEAWYEVPDASAGRGVRCAACRTVWTATAVDLARIEAARQPALATAGERAPATAMRPPQDEPDDWAAAAEPADEPAAVDAADAPSVVPARDPLGAESFAADPATSDPITEDRLTDDPLADDRLADTAPERDWDAEFEAAEARRLAREKGKPKTKPTRRLPAPSWITAALALMVVIGALLAWRIDVVRLMPQTASLFAKLSLPVNLRGLAIERVEIDMDATDDVPVVIVEGIVVNVTKVRIEVPRLRFAVRDASGAEIHTWTVLPQKPSLAPGEAQPFRTRLASPPADGREVMVRFFNRRDR